MNSSSSDPPAPVTPTIPAQIGLIVSDHVDIDRSHVAPRAQPNPSYHTTVFSMVVERISRARWFMLLRRIFHYQNGLESSDVRLNPLNSGAWIFLEVVMLVVQIVGACVILRISRHEKPISPLRLWVIAYCLGCIVSLPVLYWRYKHPSSGFNQPNSSVGGIGSARSGHESASGDQNNDNSRMAFLMERSRISLDFFFAIWFVIGNVWVFGTRRSFTEDAPILHRLCIALLALSCIGYALPFMVFALLCCCMPCISAVFGLNLSLPAKHRGASSSDIAALPTHTFKSLKEKIHSETLNNNNHDDSDSDQGAGYIIDTEAGTKRRLSPHITECCICLAKYKDGEMLKELPCVHLFHGDCVDQWLKINSSCPLCKRELREGSSKGNMAYNIEDMSRRVIDMTRYSVS